MKPRTKTTPSDAPAVVEPLPKMTYEQFLAWADEDTRAEWVAGEVMLLSPPYDWHQDLGGFLMALLRFFVEGQQSGKVLSAPYQIKMGPHLPGREPDVLFVATEHLDRFKGSYLEGPADLVVEIISSDSRSRDRVDKFSEYEQGGVGEYWLVDYLRRQAEFYVRGEDGTFHPNAVGTDGIYRSAVLAGFWLRIEWLWQTPLPTLASVLQELGLFKASG
jgi:Uma2 family endonuclease